jgi:succinate dehydrogenase hydrophobic anchor subunit
MKRVSGIALVLMLILLAAVVFAPVPGDTRWLRTLHNSAHAPIFGCVALLALVVIRAHPRLRPIGSMRQYLMALATVLGLGVATEILQIPAGRDASVEDALHDTIGAIAFLGVFAVFDPRLRELRRSHLLRWVAGIVAVIALGVAAAPVTRAAIKYQQRDQRFPVIADLSQRYDRYFILQKAAEFSPVTMPKPWAAAPDESALRVRLLEGAYPGMDFIELRPDWSRFATLAVDLTNPTPLNLQLVLRVHDAAHTNQPADRFSKRIELPAGTRAVVRIPLREIAAGPRTRTLDLRQIAGVIIFRADDSPPAGEWYFSRMWLEKEPSP